MLYRRMLARHCYRKNLVFDYLCSLLFVMICTNSLIGFLQSSATAAGVKAQLAKCKHEDMPRAPCSNALCSLSSRHCTIYRARRLRPSNPRRRPPKTELCAYPLRPPPGNNSRRHPCEKITPFRQFK